MKLAVITPVGPGHTELAKEALGSVAQACAHSQGPFDDVQFIRMEDPDGEFGRSLSRNMGVLEAHETGANWIFFLDADDLMLEHALEAMEDYVNYDAVWGQIYDVKPGENFARRRIEQVPVDSITDVLNYDPYLTLQMGHFVRTEIAVDNPFDTNMDAGEDFEYYLRLWKSYSCVKSDRIFFINRRGLTSQGPKSANGAIWRKNVQKVISQHKNLIIPDKDIIH